MPSRTGMLLARRGRGPGGDPFFGAIARLAFGGVRRIVGAIAKRGRKVASGAVVGPSGGALMRSPATGKLVRVARAAAGAVGLGAAFEAGSGAVSGIFGEDGQPIKKRRQINPLNPRAARRAVSRLCRLQHFTNRLEHSLSDLVKGRHHHHGHHVRRRK